MRFALIGYGLGTFAGAFVATPAATHLYAYLGRAWGWRWYSCSRRVGGDCCQLSVYFC